MICIKYCLSRTGFFPRFEPEVSDVMTAAEKVHFIDHLRNRNGSWRWYIWPKNWERHGVRELKHLFRVNGIVLRSHYSRKYRGWVLSAVDREQPFLSDVRRVFIDLESFEKIKKRRNEEIAKRRERFDALQKVLGRNW